MDPLDPALQAAIEASAGAGANGRSFDAIVVGAGAAGGLAALLLTEAGLDVLVLDAGWPPSFLQAPYRNTLHAVVPRIATPDLAAMLPSAVTSVGRRALRAAGLVRQPVQSKCFAWMLAPASFVDDRDFPYLLEPGAEFRWFRTHQLGGRMTVPGHGWQYRRLRARVFKDWPLSAQDMAPWYDKVEARLGMRGRPEDDACFPGGSVAHAESFGATERDTEARLAARWPNAQIAMGRFAPPLPTLELAAATGRLICRRGAVASRVDVDDAGHAQGVTWFDRETGTRRSARAPIVFLSASTLETTRILLSSRSTRCPEGLGASSGVLGRHLMDHVTATASGEGKAQSGECEHLTPGRCIYIPNFGDCVGDGAAAYDMQVYRWVEAPGRVQFTGVTFGQMRPRAENRVVLDPHRTDAFGNPVLRVECRYDKAELAAAAEQAEGLRQVADALGIRLTRLDSEPAPPGTAMHEVGTARMGDAPDNSVLDPNNQCWDAKGLYVTDGAAFPSQGLNHPTLTIMALTARACAHAVKR